MEEKKIIEIPMPCKKPEKDGPAPDVCPVVDSAPVRVSTENRLPAAEGQDRCH